MKRSLLLLPLGMFVTASVGYAQDAPTNIPLPPPTPLYSNQNTTTEGTRAGRTSAPVEPLAKKKAAEYSDDELRALGTGIAFPYEYLDTVLRRFVSTKGEMYYLKAKGDNDLDTFARAVAIADLSQFPVFTVAVDPKDPTLGTKPDNTPELTFWINAYNGLRLKALADRYPVGSVIGLKDFDDVKNQVVAGKKYSFAELRDKIGKMDARALFAITSGAEEGPGVPLTVYRYSQLSDQLNQSVSAFVNDQTKVSAPDRLANKVQASPYLQQVDLYFKPKNGRRKFEGIRYLLSTYSKNGASRNYFTTGDYTINFSLADGKLNEQIGN